MSIRILCLSVLWTLAMGASADELQNLRNSLTDATPDQVLAGKMEIQSQWRNPEDKSSEADVGQVQVSFAQNERGIQITYSPALLEQLKQERAQQAKNPEADTPALEGMSHIIATELQQFLNPKEGLLSVLENYKFESESTDTFEGRELRKLRFVAGEEKVSAEEQEYIKEYSETIDIWLADDGEPVAKQKKVAYRGRAMMVIKFGGKQSSLTRYTNHNGRLVVDSFEFSEESSGGPNDSNLKVVKQLVYTDMLAAKD